MATVKYNLINLKIQILETLKTFALFLMTSLLEGLWFMNVVISQNFSFGLHSFN